MTLRAVSLRHRVPLLAALATAAAGLVNLASALTPALPARVDALLALAPVAEIRLAHALALPAGLGLLWVARLLALRRRRSAAMAVWLLVAAGALDLVKGLDWEEAALSWLLAGALWQARDAFVVAHARPRAHALVLRGGALLAGAYGTAVAAVLAAGDDLAPHAGPAAAPGRALALLVLAGGGVHAGGEFAWLPLGLGLLGAAAAAAAAGPVFAPARLAHAPGPGEREAAAAVVRRHGDDTLAAFKLRSDLGRRWSADGRALVAFTVEAGTLVLAGDPVGPPDACAALLEEACADARRHGLGLGVVGASEAFAGLAAEAGLRRLYIGDEALLPTGPVELSGNGAKSLRKAVNRVRRHGYRAELARAGELAPATLAELHRVSDRWRAGTPERGFSMAHDRLDDALLPDAAVVLARDADGTVRAFLHFLPVFGRPAVSLAFMRREPDSPNGVMDFLVVEAARLLGEAGVEELSLNFASFGRWLRAPAHAGERHGAALLRVADRWFQVERLYRYNAKFHPRWQPRYLLYDRPAALPRTMLAAMWAEGQLPRAPRLAGAR